LSARRETQIPVSREVHISFWRKDFSRCFSMKNSPRRLKCMRAVCHFSVSQIREINGEVEKKVERMRMKKNPPIPTFSLREKGESCDPVSIYLAITHSIKKLKKMSPERMLKNMTFVNSKFPETESEKGIPSVGKRFPCTRGRLKNRTMRRILVRYIYEELSLEFSPLRRERCCSFFCSPLLFPRVRIQERVI
jgi:hypothetical protein